MQWFWSIFGLITTFDQSKYFQQSSRICIMLMRIWIWHDPTPSLWLKCLQNILLFNIESIYTKPYPKKNRVDTKTWTNYMIHNYPNYLRSFYMIIYSVVNIDNQNRPSEKYVVITWVHSSSFYVIQEWNRANLFCNCLTYFFL